jgi:ribulose-phosphate 3-epimerase
LDFELYYMTTVLPAIIPRAVADLEEEIALSAHFTHLVQVDISDGIFTPFRTWPYNGRDEEFFAQLKNEEVGWPRWEDMDIEAHLMVKNPENVAEDWCRTGIVSLVAHIEATEDFGKVIAICKQHSVAVGIALKPATDIARIAPFADQVDFIQCMGSDLLGKHGEELDPAAVEKIRVLHSLYPGRIIAIDIGVTEETAPELVSAGAEKLIVGSAIFDSDDPGDEYRRMEAL